MEFHLFSDNQFFGLGSLKEVALLAPKWLLIFSFASYILKRNYPWRSFDVEGVGDVFDQDCLFRNPALVTCQGEGKFGSVFLYCNWFLSMGGSLCMTFTSSAALSDYPIRQNYTTTVSLKLEPGELSILSHCRCAI